MLVCHLAGSNAGTSIAQQNMLIVCAMIRKTTSETITQFMPFTALSRLRFAQMGPRVTQLIAATRKPQLKPAK